jgi:hypothetical protein
MVFFRGVSRANGDQVGDRVAERIVWAERPEELMQHLPRPEDLTPGIDPPRPISVMFVPAKVFDNPALLQVNPEYLAWLRSLPLLERERLLNGNWKIRPAAGLYFKREWCAVADEVRADLDVVRYWDLAATEKTEFNDPDWTVGIKLGRDKSGGYWVLDVVRGRANPGDIDRLLLKPPRKTANRSASGSARIRGRPVRASRFTWCARSATLPCCRPQRVRLGTVRADCEIRRQRPLCYRASKGSPARPAAIGSVSPNTVTVPKIEAASAVPVLRWHGPRRVPDRDYQLGAKGVCQLRGRSGKVQLAAVHCRVLLKPSWLRSQSLPLIARTEQSPPKDAVWSLGVVAST